MSTLPPMSVMLRAVERRDSDFDGVFVVAVKTTGIFCRPSCPAKPLAKNRIFMGSAADAIAAGYRPCKRCRPLQVGGAAPEWVSRLLDLVEEDPGLRLSDKILRRHGFEAVAARRYFLKNVGMTFQQFCRGRRMAEALRHVKKGVNLDAIANDFGYESLSGFRDAFRKTFGQPPGRANADCLYVSYLESPVCPLLIGATERGICVLEFADRENLDGRVKEIALNFRRTVLPGTNEHIDRTKSELKAYFQGDLRDFTVPVTPIGTVFQSSVWKQLQDIPYGETWSYEALAKAVGKPGTACRAVGGANGRNPIAIIIPCHRVVNKDGSLGGYGGGLWRKKFLLELERKALGRRNQSSVQVNQNAPDVESGF